MKVLFLEDVEGVAHGGDVKEVKRGFAKNYLLPKSIAILTTKSSLLYLKSCRGYLISISVMTAPIIIAARTHLGK